MDDKERDTSAVLGSVEFLLHDYVVRIDRVVGAEVEGAFLGAEVEVINGRRDVVTAEVEVGVVALAVSGEAGGADARLGNVVEGFAVEVPHLNAAKGVFLPSYDEKILGEGKAVEHSGGVFGDDGLPVFPGGIAEVDFKNLSAWRAVGSGDIERVAAHGTVVGVRIALVDRDANKFSGFEPVGKITDPEVVGGGAGGVAEREPFSSAVEGSAGAVGVGERAGFFLFEDEFVLLDGIADPVIAHLPGVGVADIAEAAIDKGFAVGEPAHGADLSGDGVGEPLAGGDVEEVEAGALIAAFEEGEAEALAVLADAGPGKRGASVGVKFVDVEEFAFGAVGGVADEEDAVALGAAAAEEEGFPSADGRGAEGVGLEKGAEASFEGGTSGDVVKEGAGAGILRFGPGADFGVECGVFLGDFRRVIAFEPTVGIGDFFPVQGVHHGVAWRLGNGRKGGDKRHGQHQRGE